MKMILCVDENSWNKGNSLNFSDEFLQSWQWGEFQRSVGNMPVRYIFEENGRFIAKVQGFEYRVFGIIKFVYFPKISFAQMSVQDKAVFFNFFKKQGYMFARIEPINEVENIAGYEIIKVNNRQPKNTFILHITKIEQELAENMHAKTRYNIGLADKKGVKARVEKNIDVFWSLNMQTVERDKFKSHNKEYYKKMLDMDICHQLVAYIGDAPVASNICISFGGVFTYLHGASSSEYRNLMAPYLLQWESIKLAKSLGNKKYDFGGTAPIYFEKEIKQKNIKAPTCFNNFCWDVTHKWTGITRFKVGFGGEPKNYPDMVEVVFKAGAYKLFTTIKKLI